VEALATVNRFTHYVDELQHPQQRYHHGKPSEAAIYAGIIGIGCAIGLRRMMRISRGITEAELEHTVNWHFTLDGLNAAIDRVVHLMDRLDLPNLLRRLPEQLHTSSDGQKFEVRVDFLKPTTRSNISARSRVWPPTPSATNVTCCGTPPSSARPSAKAPMSSTA
jgi:hypothetical protein